MTGKLVSGPPVNFITSSKTTLIVRKIKEFSSTFTTVKLDTLDSIAWWIEQSDRSVQLPSGWKEVLSELLDKLPIDKQFPLLDFVRLLIAHSKEARDYFTSTDKTLSHVLFRIVEALSDSTKKDTLATSSMMLQRVFCNLFTPENPTGMRYLKEGSLRASLTSLVIENLLSSNAQLSHTSALLLYNMGWSCSLLRDENAFGSETPSSRIFDMRDTEEREAWQLELTAAVCQAIEHAASNESGSSDRDLVLRLVAGCGFLLAFASESILELAQVVGLEGHLESLESMIENDTATDDKARQRKTELIQVVKEIVSLVQ